MTVVDFSYARPTVAQLQGWGVTCCMRYTGQATDKNMTPAEVAHYAAAQIRTGTVFEYGAQQALGGTAQGGTDAKLGLAQATDCGMPGWRPVYFAFDADVKDYAPSKPNVPANALAKLGPLAAYWGATAAYLGVERNGGYGGYWLISRLFDAGLITWGWQTRAWSAAPPGMATPPPNAVIKDGCLWDIRANLRQTGGTIDGGQLDLDTAIRTHDHAGDYGAWFPGEKAPGGDVSATGPEHWDAADKAALLGILLGTDGVIASPLHNPANPYWALKSHITWGGEQLAAIRSAVAALAAKVGASVDPAEIAKAVLAGLTPQQIADAVEAVLPADLARQFVDELDARLSTRLAVQG